MKNWKHCGNARNLFFFIVCFHFPHFFKKSWDIKGFQNVIFIRERIKDGGEEIYRYFFVNVQARSNIAISKVSPWFTCILSRTTSVDCLNRDCHRVKQFFSDITGDRFILPCVYYLHVATFLRALKGKTVVVTGLAITTTNVDTGQTPGSSSSDIIHVNAKVFGFFISETCTD